MLYVRLGHTARVAATLLAAIVLTASHAPAQPCGLSPDFAPGLTLPSLSASSLPIKSLVVHDDGRGPAMYIAGTPGFSYGYFASPDVQSCVGRLRAGRFERVGYSTLGQAQAAISADLGANLPGGPRLFVGGNSFRAINADGTSAAPIAMWDGAKWQPLPFAPAQMLVQSLIAFDDGQGGGTQLYIAGNTNISGTPALVVRWNGSVWQPLPLPAPGGSNSLGSDFAIFDDGSGPALYLAGSFSPSQTAAGGLAKWTGQAWTLIPGPAAGASLTSVKGFSGPQGPALYVGGSFSLPGGASQGVARLNPDGSWSGLGVPTTHGDSQTVRLSVLQEPAGPALYIGGVYLSGSATSGGYIRYDGATASTPTRTYASFNGSMGVGLGATGPAALFDSGSGPEVWIGGNFAAFSQANTPTPLASPSRSLLRVPLAANPAFIALEAGRGVNLYNAGTAVRTSMLPLRVAGRDQLGFFGPVFGAGGSAGRAYALFDGSAWSTSSLQPFFRFTAGIESRDAGLPGVLLLAATNGPVGYYPAGSSQFTSYGAGINNFVDARNMLYFDDGNTGGPILFVQDANSVKRLFNGQWQSVYSGLITSMIAADFGQGPRLLISGNVNSGTPGVAMWNGASFQPVGSAASFPGPITAIAVHDDGQGPELYVGFEGTASLGTMGPASRIARLRNNTWQPLGLGLIGSTNVRLTMASFDDGSGPALYVAGDFSRAGPSPSKGFARWRAGAWEPVLDINPRTLTGTPLLELSLAVLGDSLYLHGFLADSGLSLPGTQIINDANVVVGENLIAIRRCPPACFPDLNRDGAVDQGDVDYLINAVSGGDNPAGANLDLNSDDVVDQADVDVLVNVVAGAPCQ
ncbi:MAG: hypothetical protein GC200_11470 [Tepidisphaera sp.]|nr:hypothetical protein [Tepidisphaera sp.]